MKLDKEAFKKRLLILAYHAQQLEINPQKAASQQFLLQRDYFDILKVRNNEIILYEDFDEEEL